MLLDTKARRFWVNGLTGLLGLALLQCGAGEDEESTTASRQAIVGGMGAGVSQSPVLYLKGPQGTCTAVLVAPNLVATARHCTAQLGEGAAMCTPQGTLIPTGSGAGQIGADDSPGSLTFVTAANVAAGAAATAADAVGVQILSTQGSSICCDDLAFVVLDRPMAGLAPAPIRIDRSTQTGESVDVFGYGLTDQSMDPTLLRVREDAQIVAVGPQDPTSVPQAAPLRALRVGPGVVTCNGDSGGPIFSKTSGAVVGLVSLGSQASTLGPFCTTGPNAETTGPELADYRELVLAAFDAAGATPILEGTAPDAGTDSGIDAGIDSGIDGGIDSGRPVLDDSGPPRVGDGTSPPAVVEFVAGGGSCATRLQASDRSRPFGAIACGIAWMMVAARRRRR